MLNFRHSLVFLDCEMTGPDPALHQLLEVAALKCDPRNFKIIDQFHSLVGPPNGINPKDVIARAHPTAMQKNGIRLDNDIFRLSLPPTSVVALLKKWLPAKYILAGFGLSLDVLFLNKALREVGNEKAFGYFQLELTTLMEIYYAKFLQPEPVGRNLAALATTLGLRPGNTHRAMDDCVLAHKVFQVLTKKLNF